MSAKKDFPKGTSHKNRPTHKKMFLAIYMPVGELSHLALIEASFKKEKDAKKDALKKAEKIFGIKLFDETGKRLILNSFKLSESNKDFITLPSQNICL